MGGPIIGVVTSFSVAQQERTPPGPSRSTIGGRLTHVFRFRRGPALPGSGVRLVPRIVACGEPIRDDDRRGNGPRVERA